MIIKKKPNLEYSYRKDMKESDTFGTGKECLSPI